MSVMPPSTNPLAIARESMAMSRQSGSQVFQTVAMVTMGVMAVASALQTLRLLQRDLDKHEHGRGR